MLHILKYKITLKNKIYKINLFKGIKLNHVTCGRVDDVG